ncbi:hypothetical protein [Pontiella desulfatans]|uniref:hypothetical protein n=1 Tax=Pontiella desulfatans TaxID=2750659 RepID=UPI00109D6EEF|nr:hypothetical protein [Pontiella desulfatans]
MRTPLNQLVIIKGNLQLITRLDGVRAAFKLLGKMRLPFARRQNSIFHQITTAPGDKFFSKFGKGGSAEKWGKPNNEKRRTD